MGGVAEGACRGAAGGAAAGGGADFMNGSAARRTLTSKPPVSLRLALGGAGTGAGALIATGAGALIATGADALIATGAGASRRAIAGTAATAAYVGIACISTMEGDAKACAASAETAGPTTCGSARGGEGWTSEGSEGAAPRVGEAISDWRSRNACV